MEIIEHNIIREWERLKLSLTRVNLSDIAGLAEMLARVIRAKVYLSDSDRSAISYLLGAMVDRVH